MAEVEKTLTQNRTEEQVTESVERVERYLRQQLGFRSFDTDTLSLTHGNGITQVLSEDMHNVIGVGGRESSSLDALVLGVMVGTALRDQDLLPEFLEYGADIIKAEMGPNRTQVVGERG